MTSTAMTNIDPDSLGVNCGKSARNKSPVFEFVRQVTTSARLDTSAQRSVSRPERYRHIITECPSKIVTPPVRSGGVTPRPAPGVLPGSYALAQRGHQTAQHVTLITLLPAVGPIKLSESQRGRDRVHRL